MHMNALSVSMPRGQVKDWAGWAMGTGKSVLLTIAQRLAGVGREALERPAQPQIQAQNGLDKRAVISERSRESCEVDDD